MVDGSNRSGRRPKSSGGANPETPATDAALPGPSGPSTINHQPSTETKRQRMASMFARVARGYDRLNTLLSLGMHHRWRRFAVRECRFPPGGLALDVATGTADFVLELIGRGGRAVGVDPCPPMLAAGREKLRQAGISERALLVVGEAEHLPVPSDRFDCATIGFALR